MNMNMEVEIDCRKMPGDSLGLLIAGMSDPRSTAQPLTQHQNIQPNVQHHTQSQDVSGQRESQSRPSTSRSRHSQDINKSEIDSDLQYNVDMVNQSTKNAWNGEFLHSSSSAMLLQQNEQNQTGAFADCW